MIQGIPFCCGPCVEVNSTRLGCACILMTGAPEVVLGKPGIEPATPDLQGIALILKQGTLICGFPWVVASSAGFVYDLCFYFITGRRSP